MDKKTISVVIPVKNEVSKEAELLDLEDDEIIFSEWHKEQPREIVATGEVKPSQVVEKRIPLPVLDDERLQNVQVVQKPITHLGYKGDTLSQIPEEDSQDQIIDFRVRERSSDGGSNVIKSSNFPFLLLTLIISIIFFIGVTIAVDSLPPNTRKPTVDTPPAFQNKQEVVRAREVVLEPQKQEVAKRAEERLLPPPWKIFENKNPKPVVKQLVSLSSSACRNKEEKDLWESNMEIKNVDRQGVSYQASPGCTWVHTSRATS